MQILNAGIKSAMPENFIFKFVKKDRLICARRTYKVSDYDHIWLVAIGKAADQMAKSVHDIIRSDGGLVIIPKNYTVQFRNKKFQILKAGHPTPNKNSVLAAKKIIKFLQNTGKSDLIVFLISGGTSALVCAPFGINLNQKISITKTLLESGVSISEINTIRKHLSAIKGGRILESLQCQAISYVMSDVVGDDLGSIGSGITYCDRSTFSDCLGIVSKYGLAQKIPKAALKVLRNGAAGKISETPKSPKIPNQIIATNSDCLGMMAKKAKSLGYSTTTYSGVSGDVGLAAKKILQKANLKKNNCLIFGGEPTVRLAGNGKGGRNQELVLHMISILQQNAIVASIGTDGIDGNTKHAGAIFDHKISKNTSKPYLQNNDSSSFFKKFGGLITIGPTHSNLLDIGLVLSK